MADFDPLWNFNDPASTERKFLALLPRVTDPGLRAELLTQIARTQGLQRRFDEAHHTLDTVKAMLPLAGAVAGIRYLLERGRVFNSSGQKENAKPLFLRAFEEAANGTYAIDAAHMMAIVEPADEALEWNRRALAMAEHADAPGGRKWLGSLYNNTGWSLHDLGRYEEALEMFREALRWYQEEQQLEKTRIARWTVARCLRSLGRLAEALAIQRDLAEGPNDGYVWEELGECLLALGRTEEAQPHFARAYAELAKDASFVSNEAARLNRLKSLGDSK